MKTARILVILFISIFIFIICIGYSGLVSGKNPHVTPEPTEPPTPEPTEIPTETPTPEPTIVPTETPTPEPTVVPTDTPTPEPTIIPTDTPTPEPTVVPTESPTPTISPEPNITPVENSTPAITPEPTTIIPTLTPVSSDGGGGGGGGSFFFPSESSGLPSTWYSCDMKGAMLSSNGGGQQITLDLIVAGDAIDLYNNSIVFKNKGLQISIETEETLNPINNQIKATVKKVILKTDPIVGELKKTGAKFLVLIEATYPEAPPIDSGIRLTLSDAPSDNLVNSFQEGSKNHGFTIQGIAYTMNVHTSNLSSSIPVTITMSMPLEWVIRMGRNTVRIVRLADDGSTEILETKTNGYDQFGSVLFVAESPHGFSTYGLASMIEGPESNLVITSIPVTSTETLPTMSPPYIPPNTFSQNASFPWFIAPALIIFLMGVGIANLYLIIQARKGG